MDTVRENVVSYQSHPKKTRFPLNETRRMHQNLGAIYTGPTITNASFSFIFWAALHILHSCRSIVPIISLFAPQFQPKHFDNGSINSSSSYNNNNNNNNMYLVTKCKWGTRTESFLFCKFPRAACWRSPDPKKLGHREILALKLQDVNGWTYSGLLHSLLLPPIFQFRLINGLSRNLCQNWGAFCLSWLWEVDLTWANDMRKSRKWMKVVHIPIRYTYCECIYIYINTIVLYMYILHEYMLIY